MQLNDSGQLVIYQGNNGIKTNANEASVQTRTPGTANNTTSITLNTITYDTADTTYNATNKLIGLESTATNNTPVTQSYPYNVSLAYTDSETFTWNVSATLSATISSSTKITIPGIGDQTETISLTGSTTISQGQSTTQTQTTTISAGGNTSVPEFSQFVVYETAEEQIATVPYTWTGIAYYANGVSAPITGSGSVVSDTTGLFNIETDCVYTPDGCTTVGLGSPPAVPEPPTIITVPLAFAALLALAAVRRRRRRGTLRDNGLGMLSPA
jgi:MYXO-CTERM domain-containing protein